VDKNANELIKRKICVLLKFVNYLYVSNYKDLQNKKERFLYRLFEMFPGLLIWGTFGLAVLVSWWEPIWAAFFIISFDIYWVFKIVYLAIHTRSAYRRMKKQIGIDWTRKLEELGDDAISRKVKIKSYKDLWHLVILPSYKEPYEVVKGAIDSIAKSEWPKQNMILVMAVEESGGDEGYPVAARIKEEYKSIFPNFFIIKHPSNLPGESPGKGSNERCAGVWAKDNFIDNRNIPYENVIVSSLDSDTVVYPQYFTCLAYHYLTCENPLRSSFQPIPLFVNNIWEAPAISRVISFSSTFWHAMNQERPEKLLTFSSHSMSFKALVDVGFWQANVVSEDSRIFWQCLFYYDGDYKVVPLYYPVCMDANVARNLLRTLINVYKQQRRWAYGSADIAYFLFGFMKNKKMKTSQKLHHGFYVTEGFYSWGTNAILIFVLGWLPLALGGDEFNTTLLSFNLPRITRFLLTIGMVGIISSVFLSLVLLPPRPPEHGKRKYIVMVLQWLLIPATLIIFGAFPAIEAQTRLMFARYLPFWPTEKFRK